MTDNITLPRADAEQIRAALVSGEKLFAALSALAAALAEPEPDAIARAVEAEREACARVCEMQENRIVQTHPARIEFDPNSIMAQKCAAVIRARGSK